MSISPARTAAFDILLQVEQRDAYASEMLHSSPHDRLSTVDHGLATELVMGVLRWKSFLDEYIANPSFPPLEKFDIEVLLVLRLAAYQLLFMSRVPPHAVVNESVELVKRARKRSAASLVNAALRKLAPRLALQRDAMSTSLGLPLLDQDTRQISDRQSLESLAQQFAHPLWLVRRWVERLGIENARLVCQHDQKIPETALHCFRPVGETDLPKADLKPGKLLASALRISAAVLTRTSAFRDGAVVAQDEASQLVALLAGKGTTILDCCAAPGGKTRILAERNPTSTIVAAELHPHRATILKRRAAEKNVRVIAADACNLPLRGPFDRVLVDVPCSGTGTLARNPEIKWRLKPDDLRDLQARQVSILKSAMQQVALGGKIIYSTCSLESEENEEVVSQALQSDTSFRVVDCRGDLELLRTQGELTWQDLNSLVKGPFLQTIPGAHPCDGFFAAALQKT